MIQPKGIPPKLERPPASPAPEEAAAADGAEDGREAEDGGGSEGVEERGIGGAAGGASPGSGIGVEDAPAYPGAGWKRPEQAQRDCVQNSVRIPSGLRGFVSGPITVKFAIGADGAPSAFQLIGSVPDARIGGAIWQAIQSCRWIAGADAEGRPARLWVIMPIRFQAG